jgi:copper(I)-binding protein
MKVRLFLMLLCLFLVGCSSDTDKLEIQDAWVRPADAGMNTAIYFVINNTGEQDRLLKAETIVAEMTEIHISYLDDSSVMRMEKQESVMIPANQKLAFEPGGLHVMLINLSRDIKIGDQVQLRLHFENKGEITIDVSAETP